MKQLLKKILKSLPADTRSRQYDGRFKKVIAEVCSRDSNCIDIGAHKGAVLDIMLKYAPQGKHHAFEPIPALYEVLIRKYAANRNCLVHSCALSNVKGTTTFQVEVPGAIDNNMEKHDETIEVQTEVLDNILPADYKPGLVTIDAAGSVLQVLEGATRTLKEHKPVVIFHYKPVSADPGKIYELFNSCTMRISTMQRWLNNRPCLNKDEFAQHYHQKKDYCFIAYP
ncbi:MAG TPA: FkbM family methyltransferase [Flavipsychrobacter sp.]